MRVDIFTSYSMYKRTCMAKKEIADPTTAAESRTSLVAELESLSLRPISTLQSSSSG